MIIQSLLAILMNEIIKEGYVHSTVEGQSEILDKLKHVCDELGLKYSLDLTPAVDAISTLLNVDSSVFV